MRERGEGRDREGDMREIGRGRGKSDRGARGDMWR